MSQELTELDAEIRLLSDQVDGLASVMQEQHAAEQQAEAGLASVEEASTLFGELDEVSSQLADQAARVSLLDRGRDLFQGWHELIAQAERQAPRLGEWPGPHTANPLLHVESLARAARV